MTHEAKRVATKVLAGGNYAECYRCCGDPATDSWITAYNPATLPPEHIAQEVAKHAQDVAARHERMEAALTWIPKEPSRRCGPALAHQAHVSRCERWNNEQVKVCCGCCSVPHLAEGVVTVFSKTDEEVRAELRCIMECAAREHATVDWAENR